MRVASPPPRRSRCGTWTGRRRRRTACLQWVTTSGCGCGTSGKGPPSVRSSVRQLSAPALGECVCYVTSGRCLGAQSTAAPAAHSVFVCAHKPVCQYRCRLLKSARRQAAAGRTLVLVCARRRGRCCRWAGICGGCGAPATLLWGTTLFCLNWMFWRCIEASEPCAAVLRRGRC